MTANKTTMKHSITKYVENGVLNFDRLHKELQENVELGYINKKTKGDLALYDYSKSCTYERAWNDATRIARGLVLDEVNKKVVALPFEKFFNEGGEHQEHGLELGEFDPNGFFEKMDGSCGIVYFYNGEWHVNTRGSFDSDQAVWAKNFLNKEINKQPLHSNVTYIVEIIYKENKIVVDYKGCEGLVMIGAYVHDGVQFGEEGYVDADYMEDLCHYTGFCLPMNNSFSSLDAARIATKDFDHNQEGFVYRSKNGVRVKIKSEEYCRIHGLISYHTPLFLWRCFVEHGAEGCKERKKDIPEELWGELDEWLDIFEKNVEYALEEIKKNAEAVKHLTDKELGLKLKELKNGSHWKGWIFNYRNNKNFGQVGDKSFRSICNLFEPKNNVIGKLYE